MYCSECYRMIPDDSKTCPNCGADISERTCINCGIPVLPGERVCRQCGMVLDGYQEPLKKTVDWTWGDSRDDTEKSSQPEYGSWSDFRKDAADFFQKHKPHVDKTKREPVAAEYQSVKERCPYCGGTEFSYQATPESKGTGCFIWLVIALVIPLAFLFASYVALIVVLLLLILVKKPTKTVTYAVCQTCGQRKKVSEPFEGLSFVIGVSIFILLWVFFNK